MTSTKKANRPVKRNLVRWNDDLDKQVLLIVQYACNEAGVRIPWDDVARMMCEVTDQPVTGGAIIQHLSKLRSRMESYELGVPPPLKRGLPANTPSKIYAPGNKRKVKPTKTKTPKPNNVKPKKFTARKLKTEDEEDSEGSLVFYEGEDEEEEEEEDSEWGYGSAKKQRRVSVGKGKGKGKGKKNVALAPEMEEDVEAEGETSKLETTSVRTDVVKRGSLIAEADIQESIESQSPLHKNRGFKHISAKTETDYDDNSEGGNGAQAEEEVEEEEKVKEEIKYGREISPHTKFENSGANLSGFLDLTSDVTQGYSNAGFGLDLQSTYHFGQTIDQRPAFQTQEYQMTAQNGHGFSQSTGSSFSANRTGSMASRNSAMASPYTPHASPASYAAMTNNGMATHDFGNDEIMYVDQYLSPIDYSSSDFLSSFNNPFSIAQNDSQNGEFL